MRTLCILLIGFLMIVPFVSGAGGNKPVTPPSAIWTVKVNGSNSNIYGIFNPNPNAGVETKAVYTPPSRSCSDYCVGSTFEVKLTASKESLYFSGIEMKDAGLNNQVRCNFENLSFDTSPTCLAKFLNDSPYPSENYQYTALKVSLYGINFEEITADTTFTYVAGSDKNEINRARIYLNVASGITDCTFTNSSVASNAMRSVEEGAVSIKRVDGNTWRILVQGVSLDLYEYGYGNISSRRGDRCSYYSDSDYENGIWTEPINFEMTFTRSYQ
jgi:hypothetical protein